jgi:sugar/nucleoside kinase (ribokinase family)
MSVLVVGTVAFDSIETPAGSVERVLGGSAAYFALGASYFAPVRIVGVIGQDFPQDYLDLFTERGVDIQGIKQERGDTFHWRGRYHEDINLRDTLGFT